MNHTDLLRLMHTVLDGEANAGEKAALERHLAGDPLAQAEFDELSRLFDGLAKIPKAYPPEGLVASVMAQVPHSTAGQGRLRQPFSRPRVIGADSRESPDTIPGKSTGTPRLSRQGPYFRSDNMSEQKSGSSWQAQASDRRRHCRGGRDSGDLLGNRLSAWHQGYDRDDRAGRAVSGSATDGCRRQARRASRDPTGGAGRAPSARAAVTSVERPTCSGGRPARRQPQRRQPARWQPQRRQPARWQPERRQPARRQPERRQPARWQPERRQPARWQPAAAATSKVAT